MGRTVSLRQDRSPGEEELKDFHADSSAAVSKFGKRYAASATSVSCGSRSSMNRWSQRSAALVA
jgi:hypothetical protein